MPKVSHYPWVTFLLDFYVDYKVLWILILIIFPRIQRLALSERKNGVRKCAESSSCPRGKVPALGFISLVLLSACSCVTQCSHVGP